MISFTLNGQKVRFDGDGDMPLLWYLREDIKLRGTKFGCGIGSCGACTLHIDGAAARSCQIAMDDVAGSNITTIEGLSPDGMHPVQRAWAEEDVSQCGYCQGGQIMAAVDFLGDNPAPTDKDIDENITNLCRCGTYTSIRRAIHRAAEIIGAEANGKEA